MTNGATVGAATGRCTTTGVARSYGASLSHKVGLQNNTNTIYKAPLFHGGPGIKDRVMHYTVG